MRKGHDMTRRKTIRRAAASARSQAHPGAANRAVAAVAQHLLLAATLTFSLICGLLGHEDLGLGRLVQNTGQPLVPLALLTAGFFGLISCGMFATAAAIGDADE
jgi:hypothetical protein